MTDKAMRKTANEVVGFFFLGGSILGGFWLGVEEKGPYWYYSY